MSKSYLFIVPLSPSSHKTANRLALRKLCFESLLMQNYPNWKALVIGEYTEGVPEDEKLLKLLWEGTKEGKLEQAVMYIEEQGLTPDYIIRLDDDDVFNPNILHRIKDLDFDVYVDMYHQFWRVNERKVSCSLKLWFPNTCILNAKDALTVYGHKSLDVDEQQNHKAVLLENEHNNFHLYFTKYHKVLFAEKKHPVYLRAITPDSISFANASDVNQYVLHFGYWKSNDLPDFQFLRQFVPPVPYVQLGSPYDLWQRLKNAVMEIRLEKDYRKILGLEREKSQKIKWMRPNYAYQRCAKCVLDSNDDPNITFDEDGVCNYCDTFSTEYERYISMSNERRESELRKMVERIKADGQGKKYDCICGVSGGVDSSYLAVKAKEYGLRTLLVHFDNGWNSELAVKNIEQLCKHCDADLFTYVVDWEEFRDLQLAYIKAGVLDWEVPTDHGLWAVILKKAKELGVKHVLIGANYQTEGILPKTMRYDKADLKNIRDIYRKYGKRKKFKTFPVYRFWWHMYLRLVWGLKLDTMLYFMEYNKSESKKYLVDVVGWRDYGGKHYESIFTRFYQGYVLKEKFGFDKRKAHLASLINSKQISREEALDELDKPSIDPDLLNKDLDFFVKKMGLTAAEFDGIMKSDPVPHEKFDSYSKWEYPLFKRMIGLAIKVKRTFKKR